MVDHVVALANKWLSWDKNQETRLRISELLANEDWKTLENILSEPLKFGTAGKYFIKYRYLPLITGLRAEMDAGFARMNDFTVIQATQVCLHSL